mmetsp:Transcript_34264/g.51703  ORF Transcript_34264/g.51703 Transcript_34264/m.51703 type:complete len:200 (-) Transcript_34264:275-874(-)
MFLECLQFSVGECRDIAVPCDRLWETVTDIDSYPNIFSLVHSIERHDTRKSSADGEKGSRPTGRINIGSKWRLTRISKVEKAQYTADVTVTAMSEEPDRYCITASMENLLGSTCLHTQIVEPVGKKNSDGSYSSSRYTVIMAMVPHSIFVKLWGTLFCRVCIKKRVYLTLEQDVDDLAEFCGEHASTREQQEIKDLVRT